MLVRVVKMHFVLNFIPEFTTLFNEVKPQIANFKGCKGVKLLQHETDKAIFFTISNWDDATSLENYRNSELFKTTWAKVKPNFKHKAEAWSLLDDLK